MSKLRLLLPLVAIPFIVGGCDPGETLVPGVEDGPEAQFATFPPASVAMIGGTSLNTNPTCGSSGPAANVMGATFGGSQSRRQRPIWIGPALVHPRA